MRTTVNLGLRPLKKIIECADELNVSPGHLMYRCLRKKIALLARSSYSLQRKAVKYQPRFTDCYQIIHVSFDWDFYDANLLSRFVWKLSVSLILSQAIDEFLDNVKKEFEKKHKVAYNYPDFSIKIEKQGDYPSLLWDIFQKIIEKPTTS